MTTFLRRIVNLEQRDYEALQRAAREMDLGDIVFSAAQRQLAQPADNLAQLEKRKLSVSSVSPPVQRDQRW